MNSAIVDSRMSLGRLFASFRWEILCTWFLVVFEAGLMLMFPLVLGFAIDQLLGQAYLGLCCLGGLGVLAVLVGWIRRLYDTRVYSRIYVVAGLQIVQQGRGRRTDVSIISARTQMARELVEFFENSFPEIINCLVGILGTIVMIWVLQIDIFVACLVATGLIVVIYLATSKTTYQINKQLNRESEKQVSVFVNKKAPEVKKHLSSLMRWNIRLSDLESLNHALSWIVMVVLIVFSVAATIRSGVTDQGKVLAVLMYVFAYVESVIAAPLFYQQLIRLKEISHRLVGDGGG